MIDRLLTVIAPHYCYGCGEVGHPLCDNCAYDIIHDGYDACLVCGKPSLSGVCQACAPDLPFSSAMCVAARSGVARRLLDEYKFERARAAAVTIAGLMHACYPDLPSGMIVTTIPTISSHIRQRGYDHAALLARRFVRLRGLEYRSLLERNTRVVQRGNGRQVRERQMQGAFACGQALGDRPVLVFDDIYTTGATLRAAASALAARTSGEVHVAVFVRQPLEK